MMDYLEWILAIISGFLVFWGVSLQIDAKITYMMDFLANKKNNKMLDTIKTMAAGALITAAFLLVIFTRQ